MVQGSAAQVLKLKLIQLAQAGLQDYLVIPVHDEVILEIPDDRLSESIHTVSDIMNDATLFAVPLEAEITIGKSWGAKRPYVT
jgi:DNA polymerase-1